MTLPGLSPSPLLFSFPGVTSRLAHILLLLVLEQMCFCYHCYHLKRPAIRDLDILQTCFISNRHNTTKRYVLLSPLHR